MEAVIEEQNSIENEDRSQILEENKETDHKKYRLIILEPAVFLINFGISFSSTVLQNQLLYQSCMTVFHHSEEECEPMLGKVGNASQAIENEVQPYASQIIMTISLISSIGPAVASLFIGPWTDRYGRRPILLATSAGMLLHYLVKVILALLSSSSEFSPWLYVLGPILSTIVGGNCAFAIVNYCYVADVAPPKSKDLRIFYSLSSLGIGVILANVASGFVFKATNTETVFGLSTICMLLAFIYLYFFAPESVEVADASFKEKMLAFVSPRLMKDLIRTCIKRRPNSERGILLMTMISLIVVNFALVGETNVFYLFLRKKFNITVTDFSTYNGAASVMQMFGAFIAMVVLKKYCRIPALTVGCICLFFCIIQSIIHALAAYWWQIYLAAFVGQLSKTVYPILLAYFAQLAPPSEFGKIFALTNALETVSPLAAAPLYTGVYNASITFYPGLFFFVSTLLFASSFISLSVLLMIQKRRGQPIFRTKKESTS